MKLFFFYGPPASGKLTVAKEFSRIKGYKVFHNHLTIDLIESLFDWGTKPFDQFLTKYRLELIEAAAAEKIPGLIFTYVYGGESGDNKFIEKIVRIVKKHKGDVHFVQFVCPKKVLEKRIKHPSRKKLNKIKTLSMLRMVMKKYDLYKKVPHSHSLTIDTSELSPKEAALTIQQHCKILKKS